MSHHVEALSSMTCLDCGHGVADHRAHDRFNQPLQSAAQTDNAPACHR